jgi:hypothetical protein
MFKYIKHAQRLFVVAQLAVLVTLLMVGFFCNVGKSPALLGVGSIWWGVKAAAVLQGVELEVVAVKVEMEVAVKMADGGASGTSSTAVITCSHTSGLFSKHSSLSWMRVSWQTWRRWVCCYAGHFTVCWLRGA